jgi:cysteine sulfinate desulfinase/cysteine desulfurase-like protein
VSRRTNRLRSENARLRAALDVRAAAPTLSAAAQREAREAYERSPEVRAWAALGERARAAVTAARETFATASGLTGAERADFLTFAATRDPWVLLSESLAEFRASRAQTVTDEVIAEARRTLQ